MDKRTQFSLMSGVEKFPIGGTFKESDLEKMDFLTAKAAIIAYLAGSDGVLSEDSTRNMLEDALSSSLPELPLAEGKLRLSPGFIQDYNKVQLIKEMKVKNDETITYDDMMKLIASVAKEYGYTNGMSR